MKTALLFTAAAAVALSVAACAKKEAATEESSTPAAETSTPTTEATAPAPEAVACPTVTVATAPLEGVQGATFTADVTPQADSYTYNWTVSAGTITSGQGTSGVSVEAPQGEMVTATVDIGGLDASCASTSSSTAEVQ